jgi:hypothetical protein
MEARMRWGKRKKDPERKLKGAALILFSDVKEAMRAEKLLKDSEYQVKMVSPPPELREGCALAIQILLLEQPGIEASFSKSNIPHTRIVPIQKGTPELLNLVRVTDFGKWMMVRAGNMKITFEKETGAIVNTSGGGCPDIPFLNLELLGKSLLEAPRPAEMGRTLCARMLDRAFEESMAIWREGSKA